MNYWERLKFLKMYSQERRMERYRALYVWKILEGISPNCGLITTFSERRGREIAISPVKGSVRVQSMREGSFHIHGARLFNSLPKKIQNMTNISLDDFKMYLDKYLETIPDEPKIGGYIPSTCSQTNMAPSNSIIDQARAAVRRGYGG